MTELQAINKMLAAVGESPVNSLTAALPEVASAKTILDAVSEEVQAKGWHFNTDYDYWLSPNIDYEIVVPDGALNVDASDANTDITVRSGKLYDKLKHGYRFKNPVLVDITWLFTFDDLPRVVQQYVSIKAARRFQREYLGSQTAERLTEQDENEAYIALLDLETTRADYNLLSGNDNNLRAQLRI